MNDDVWKAAVALALKGEFIASAMLTGAFGEKPVWVPSEDGRSMTIRNR